MPGKKGKTSRKETYKKIIKKAQEKKKGKETTKSKAKPESGKRGKTSRQQSYTQIIKGQRKKEKEAGAAGAEFTSKKEKPKTVRDAERMASRKGGPGTRGYERRLRAWLKEYGLSSKEASYYSAPDYEGGYYEGGGGGGYGGGGGGGGGGTAVPAPGGSSVEPVDGTVPPVDPNAPPVEPGTGTVQGAPSWWKFFKPTAAGGEKGLLLSITNMMLPYMTPEDQRRTVAQLYSSDPKAFASYDPTKIKFDWPAGIYDEEGNISQQAMLSYTGKERANAAMAALEQLRAAIGKDEGELGPGFQYIKSILAAMRDYGATGTLSGEPPPTAPTTPTEPAPTTPSPTDWVSQIQNVNWAALNANAAGTGLTTTPGPRRELLERRGWHGGPLGLMPGQTMPNPETGYPAPTTHIMPGDPRWPGPRPYTVRPPTPPPHLQTGYTGGTRHPGPRFPWGGRPPYGSTFPVGSPGFSNAVVPGLSTNTNIPVGMTRAQAQALLAALDPLLAMGQSGELGAYGPLAEALGIPFFTGGEMFPFTKTDTGYLFGKPSKKLWF